MFTKLLKPNYCIVDTSNVLMIILYKRFFKRKMSMDTNILILQKVGEVMVNPFHSIGLFLHTLKTLENL